MEEAPWRRRHGGGTMEEASWRRLLGGGILEEAFWSIQEASRRHPGASRRHLEASGIMEVK